MGWGNGRDRVMIPFVGIDRNRIFGSHAVINRTIGPVFRSIRGVVYLHLDTRMDDVLQIPGAEKDPAVSALADAVFEVEDEILIGSFRTKPGSAHLGVGGPIRPIAPHKGIPFNRPLTVMHHDPTGQIAAVEQGAGDRLRVGR